MEWWVASPCNPIIPTLQYSTNPPRMPVAPPLPCGIMQAMSDALPGTLHEQQQPEQQNTTPRWLILGVLAVVVPFLAFFWMRAGQSLINPNTATREQLMALPEVGPEIADRILKLRPYTDEADFGKRVTEVTPQLLAQIRARLDFDGDGQGDCCVVH